MKNGLIAVLLCLNFHLYGNPIELATDPHVVLEDAERIGINLGTWTTWGAEQFNQNVLMNPGFEGSVDRVIVVVSQADKVSFSDEADWGYDDDYWKNAYFEVRTGTSKGAIGKVTHSLRKGPNGLPLYVTEKPLPPLDPLDIITLTKLGNEDPIPLWWIAETSKSRVHADPTERRPLSSGTQALALEPTANAPAEIDYYLDAISERGGKLLPVNGKWRFSIWAKSDSDGNTLHVLFHRLNGTQPFFEQIIPVGKDWKEHSIDFDARDDGAPQTLQLKISAVGAKGKVWLDDAFLGPLQKANTTSFRQEVVDLLLKLKPSFIRDTQGQLGDTFQNRIADIYARRAASTRAFAGARSLSTLYSIPDLLALCAQVKANPWIVVPPTFSDEEAFMLGEYLSQHATKTIFPAVVVEFGNENWNWVFRATSIPYAQQHGIVAEKVFQQIQEGTGGKVNLRKVVNGQYAAPSQAKDFLQFTPNADALAIAPYFFYTLDAGHSQEENLKELFKSEVPALREIVTLLQPLQKSLYTYEVNLHTTKGTAAGPERDLYTAGQAAGSALAKHLLEGMLLGIHPEIVFSLSQLDADTEGGRGKVKLWGISRDLAASNHLRPQGLAMVMLNAVIGGNLHAIRPTDLSANITAAAFKLNNQWKAAAVNASGSPLDVSLQFQEGMLPTSLWTLSAASPTDTNESKQAVTITRRQLKSTEDTAFFTIPAWGFVVLNTDEAIP